MRRTAIDTNRHGGTGRRSPANRPVAIALACFLILCLLGGGASRMSDTPLILIRPVAVLLVGMAMALAPVQAFHACRVPLLLLGMFALSMLIQLIPLPPELWRTIPFRGTYADLLAATGLDGVWRPISIAPDLTINSLLALLPALATMLGTATLDETAQQKLLAWVLAGMAASAVLGLAQFVGGDASSLYLWLKRSEAVADGVFANRNHQALFLDCGLVLLAARITPSRGAPVTGIRLALGLAAALLFLIGVIATGSRTGTLLALVAAGYSYWTVTRSAAFGYYRVRLPRPAQHAVRWSWLVLPLLLLAMALAGRATSFQRLAGIDAAEDQRVSSLPVLLNMAKAVLPWGSGFGTFDPLFRTFEPDRLLRFTVFNHAHDDFLETLIAGGLPATTIMILAAAWWVARTRKAFLPGAPRLGERSRAAAVAILLIGVASAVDYPVRTPLIDCLLAILAVWLADPPQAMEERSRKP